MPAPKYTDADYLSTNRILNLPPSAAAGHPITHEQLYNANRRLIDRAIIVSDIWVDRGSSFDGFMGASIGSGGGVGGPLVSGGPNVSGHPGVARLTCPATANTGYYIGTAVCLVCNGTETFSCTFSPQTINANIVGRIGISTSINATAPTDGVWAAFNGATNTLTANTMLANVSTVGTTSPALTGAAWYTLLITVANTTNLATFSLRTDNGAVVWSDTITTNIPNNTRRVGAGIAFWSTVATATTLVHLDRLELDIPSNRGVA